MKLHEITSAYTLIESLMDDDTVDEAQLLAAIDDVDAELKTKVENVIALVENLEAVGIAIRQSEERMNARRKMVENRIAAIKKYVLQCMQKANIHKIECPLFKISRQATTPSVVIDDEAHIPLEYLRQPPIPMPAPDKAKIKEDILLGVVIDGCRLVQNERLVIK